MTPINILLLVAVLVTVVAESVLWMMFRRKIEPLAFPHELDTSYFRFFGIARLRIVAITHAIVMLALLFICYFFLW